MQIKPIGVIHIEKDKICRIEISPEYADGLDGLAPGDTLDVLYWMHRLSDTDRRRLRVHPRGDKSKSIQGVFSLRSPMRPNPVGVTAVDLIACDGTTLQVRGLDAKDGSPVIDIKRSRRHAS